MDWLRRLWTRWFGKPKAELPAPTAPKTPLEKWHRDYDGWLNDLQEVFGKFPDHSVLEGQTFGEAEGRILDEISDLYAEEACRVVEMMVLKGESLRRRLEKR
jgi:hypothetical protein